MASSLRTNPIVRLFTSIWLGVSLLVAILLYASIFSALPQVRGAMEVTEMEAFRHWVFVALIALFCTALATVTCVRIRWTLVNLGVLVVHAGLLTLCGGALWYFGTKHEGDLVLRSPRIELWSASGGARPFAQFLAEPGQRWESFMPAFGGAVAVEVLEVEQEGLLVAKRARLRVTLGGQPRELTLDANESDALPVSDRLSLRLWAAPPVEVFYDDELPALWYGQRGQARQLAPIRRLPLHRERYLDEGYTLEDRAGRPSPSKRTTPAVRLAGLSIPTGWFEPWRMPIPLDTPGLPFDVRITGYLPYVGDMTLTATDGGAREFPAANVTLSAGGRRVADSLFAFDPARSLSDRMNLEFRWVATAVERDALLREMLGPHELAIECLDPPARQTLAVSVGQKIQLAGTPYELTVREILPSWPLMTPGFENASSPVARVDVTNGQKSYNRTVVQRFPDLSQDIDEQGVRHRDGPYDPNLRLAFRTCAEGWAILVAGPDLEPELAVFEPSGRVTRRAVRLNEPASLSERGADLTFTLAGLYRNGQMSQLPRIEPLAGRRPGLGRALSAVRLRLTGRGEHADWSESRWVMFSQYPDVDAMPVLVTPPGAAEPYELLYSRYPRKLNATVAPRALRVKLHPGGRNADTWRSDFLVQTPDGPARDGMVQTNDTMAVQGWTLFQSGAAQDHWSFTILGVGNRSGIMTMLAGCVMITLGCLYAFYVKPVLRRRKALRALQAADPARARPPKQRARQLTEVGA